MQRFLRHPILGLAGVACSLAIATAACAPSANPPITEEELAPPEAAPSPTESSSPAATPSPTDSPTESPSPSSTP